MITLLILQAAAQQPLNLACSGGGTANKAAVASVESYGSFSGNMVGVPFSGSTSGSSTIIGRRQQDFDDQTDLRLFAGDDRIRLPRTMLPPLHGGSDGWFKLKDVTVDARSIRAKAAVNFINSPRIYIDRVTGAISISGKSGDYTGQCESINPDEPAKF
jgi:hypothetical protein